MLALSPAADSANTEEILRWAKSVRSILNAPAIFGRQNQFAVWLACSLRLDILLGVVKNAQNNRLKTVIKSINPLTEKLQSVG